MFLKGTLYTRELLEGFRGYSWHTSPILTSKWYLKMLELGLNISKIQMIDRLCCELLICYQTDIDPLSSIEKQTIGEIISRELDDLWFAFRNNSHCQLSNAFGRILYL